MLNTSTTVVIGAGPRRARHEPVPHRARHRPCRARARRGGQFVAHRALGLAPPAHAELAEPSPRLRLSTATIPTATAPCPKSSRSSTTTPRRSPPPVETHTTVDVGQRPTATDTVVATDHGEWRCRTVVRRDRRLQRRRMSRRSPRRCRPGIATLSSDGIPQSRPARPRRRARRRRVGHRHPARRRDPPLRPPGDAVASASISARRAPIAVATSSGGWTGPAYSTNATTRSTTSTGRERCPRCS